MDVEADETIIPSNKSVAWYDPPFQVVEGEMDKATRKIVGHEVAVQVAGFRWLSGVQADELGFKFTDLTAVPGCLNIDSILATTNPDLRWKVSNALKVSIAAINL